MYPQGEFRMPNRCGHLLVILSLAWLEATEAAGRIPMLKLTKARGYARVVQQDIQLEAGRVYQFTCAIRGSFRAGQGDHVPEFRGPGPVNMSEPILREHNGWTRLTRSVVPTKTGAHTLAFALWNWKVFEVTQIFMGAKVTGTNLVRNGNLTQGLRHWKAEGGRLAQAHLDPSQNLPVTMQGQPMTYQRFDGDREEVLAYRGQQVVLLIPRDTSAAQGATVQIVRRLDLSWDYFRDLTGREAPFSGDRLTLNGRDRITALPLLAVVEQTCGAGCGLVGRAGIEVGRGIWDKTYDNHVRKKETRGVFEYEMGRNFWFYDGALHSRDTPRYHLATAYATVYGYLAGVVGGSTTEPGNPLVDWIQNYRDAFTDYKNKPDFSRIQQGGQLSEMILGGLWLHLAAKHGRDFHRKFFRAANMLRPAVDLKDALANFVTASSIAAGRNLHDFFANDLKYPLPKDLRETLAQRFPDQPQHAHSQPATARDAKKPEPGNHTESKRPTPARLPLPAQPISRRGLRLGYRLR